MKAKPNQAAPQSGPRPRAGKKQTSFPSSGTNAAGKDSTNVHDSRRDSQPKAWGRKTKGHQDARNAKKEGGSVN